MLETEDAGRPYRNRRLQEEQEEGKHGRVAPAVSPPSFTPPTAQRRALRSGAEERVRFSAPSSKGNWASSRAVASAVVSSSTAVAAQGAVTGRNARVGCGHYRYGSPKWLSNCAAIAQEAFFKVSADDGNVYILRCCSSARKQIQWRFRWEETMEITRREMAKRQ